MAEFLDAIGLFADALSLVQFAAGNFPGAHTSSGTTIGLKAGTSADLVEAGGGINEVYCYDFDNQPLGSGVGGGIDQGGTFSSTCDQGDPDTQSDFVDVTFTDDAVCVAWITVSELDSSPGGVWTGDIGSYCGGTWYEQTQTAGLNPDKSPYRPRCTWFDADHTSSDYASVKFRVRAYANATSSETLDKGTACSSTLFGPDDTPVDGIPAKRDTKIRPTWMTEQLVISSIPSHSSQNLCDSETSWGPDFVDAAGQYCDMGTKTLSPLCSSQDVPGCVSLNGTSLTKRALVGRRDIQLAGKSYTKVTNW